MENTAMKLPFGMKIGTQAHTGVVHLTVMKKNAWAASVGIEMQNRVAWCAGQRGIHGCSDSPEAEITCKRCADHLEKLARDQVKREKARIKEEAYAAKLAAYWAK